SRKGAALTVVLSLTDFAPCLSCLRFLKSHSTKEPRGYENTEGPSGLGLRDFRRDDQTTGLRQVDHFRSGVRDQPGQCDGTPSLQKKIQKLARGD
uniref:Uncharacterized protein n=1 Tax=Piliocolobus tephrosceles TaxID=591936 RepID=A0A8C9LXQ9_9PRIM